MLSTSLPKSIESNLLGFDSYIIFYLPMENNFKMISESALYIAIITKLFS